jgi:hypothetical protein
MSVDAATLKKSYAELRSSMVEVLFRLDPMGIAFSGDDATELGVEANYDEYSPEVDSILPRLKEARSEEDVSHIVREEFVKWFGPISVEEFSKPVYIEIRNEIWRLWMASLLSRPSM